MNVLNTLLLFARKESVKVGVLCKHAFLCEGWAAGGGGVACSIKDYILIWKAL